MFVSKNCNAVDLLKVNDYKCKMTEVALHWLFVCTVCKKGDNIESSTNQSFKNVKKSGLLNSVCNDIYISIVTIYTLYTRVGSRTAGRNVRWPRRRCPRWVTECMFNGTDRQTDGRTDTTPMHRHAVQRKHERLHIGANGVSWPWPFPWKKWMKN